MGHLHSALRPLARPARYSGTRTWQRVLVCACNAISPRLSSLIEWTRAAADNLQPVSNSRTARGTDSSTSATLLRTECSGHFWVCRVSRGCIPTLWRAGVTYPAWPAAQAQQAQSGEKSSTAVRGTVLDRLRRMSGQSGQLGVSTVSFAAGSSLTQTMTGTFTVCLC